MQPTPSCRVVVHTPNADQNDTLCEIRISTREGRPIPITHVCIPFSKSRPGVSLCLTGDVRKATKHMYLLSWGWRVKASARFSVCLGVTGTHV